MKNQVSTALQAFVIINYFALAYLSQINKTTEGTADEKLRITTVPLVGNVHHGNDTVNTKADQ
jgi:hypothetical protein